MLDGVPACVLAFTPEVALEVRVSSLVLVFALSLGPVLGASDRAAVLWRRPFVGLGRCTNFALALLLYPPHASRRA